MKKLQASYNDNANKMIKQATKEKSAINNLNFLIDLAMVSNDVKPTLEEPQTFNEAQNHPIQESCIKMARSYLQGVCQHEQATCMVKNA